MTDTDDDLFDFGLEFDDTPDNTKSAATVPQVDAKPDMADTKPETPPAKKAAPKKASGKSTGKRTGKKSKQKRIPMHERMPLSADARPGYVRRIVNDVPGRVDRLRLAGWTVVEDGTKLGDTYAGQASGTGSQSTKPVGRGISGILMEIPEDLYKEDQATKHKRIDDDEKSMLVDAAEEMDDKSGGWQGEIKYHGTAAQ